MTTSNPRIQVMLDHDTNQLLMSIATRQQQSLSATALRLIKEALELYEDAELSKLGDGRIAKVKQWHKHQDVWT